MGGYFLGIFIGSMVVPNTLSKVGHIRTFGALAAIASASILMHLILSDPISWSFCVFSQVFAMLECISLLKVG